MLLDDAPTICPMVRRLHLEQDLHMVQYSTHSHNLLALLLPPFVGWMTVLHDTFSCLPIGVSASPQCALENRATGDKYCVLICVASTAATATADAPLPVFLRGYDNKNNQKVDDTSRLEDGMCGDATCQEVQPGLGICTYDIEN